MCVSKIATRGARKSLMHDVTVKTHRKGVTKVTTRGTRNSVMHVVTVIKHQEKCV